MRHMVKIPFLRYWRLTILALLPLLITLINPNWIYNPPLLNNVDTWVYNGLFRYFFEFADKHPSDIHYFIERLSWVMPGYTLYHIFNPEMANAVLHLGVHLLTVFSLFAVMRRLFGADSAFIAALCLGGYTWFLRAAGHDYVDGIGLAYLSAALWLATEAAFRANYRWYLFGCGILLGGGLISQLFLVIYIPIIGLYYLILNYKYHRHPLVTAILYGTGGVALLIVGLMVLNVVTLGKLNIFVNSLAFISGTANSTTLRDVIFIYYAATPMTWIALPCLLICCAAIHLARWRKIPLESRFAFRFAIIIFMITFGIFLYFHLRTPYPYLILYLYMSLIIPPMFLLFAGLISLTLPNLTPRHGILLLSLVLLPFVLSITIPSLETALLNPVFVWSIAGIAIVIQALTLLKLRRVTGLVGAFAMMSLMFSGHNGVAYYDRLYTYDVFKSTITTLETIDALDPEPLNFHRYIVWEDTQQFSRYSEPLRGMSQPIYGHAVNWSQAQRQPEILRWAHNLVEDILLLSENNEILDVIEASLGDGIEIKVKHAFTLPTVDPTGQYRGYLLTLKRIDRYGEPIFPSGHNINRANIVDDLSEFVAWTGPASDVILQANLPAAQADVTVELCAAQVLIPMGNAFDAMINQTPITFNRQESDTEACAVRYIADVPQAAIIDGEFTEIAMTIPTVMADTILHNGVKEFYGMALTSVTFTEKDTP